MPAQYKIVNNQYIELTQDELDEIAAERDAIDLDLRHVRHRRDVLLSASDWTRLDDAALGDHTAEEWATYRQALRELPSTADRQSLIVWLESPPVAKVTRKTVAGQAAYDDAIASDPDDTESAQASYDAAYAATD